MQSVKKAPFNIMTYEKNRSATFADVLHFPQTFLLKFGITHRQHFVHDEDFRFQMGGHRQKRQSHMNMPLLVTLHGG